MSAIFLFVDKQSTVQDEVVVAVAVAVAMRIKRLVCRLAPWLLPAFAVVIVVLKQIYESLHVVVGVAGRNVLLGEHDHLVTNTGVLLDSSLLATSRRTVTATTKEEAMYPDNITSIMDNGTLWSQVVAQDIIDGAMALMRLETFEFQVNDYQESSDTIVVPLYWMAQSTSTLEEIINDLDDRDGDQVLCGTYKCFFPSVADPTTGWLVAPNAPYRLVKLRGRVHQNPNNLPTATRTTWHGMWYAWNLSQTLQQTHPSGIVSHFYLQDREPIVLSVAANTHSTGQLFVDKLDRVLAWQYPNATQDDVDEDVLKLFQDMHEGLTTNGLVVQRLRRAPSSIKVIKRNNEFRKFHKLVRPSGYYHDLPVTPTFLFNILRGLAVLRNVLQQYPALWHDFQFAVDRTTGHVYHVDLDRAFELFQNFRPTAKRYEQYLQRQEALIACYFHQCAAELIMTAMEFANVTSVSLQGVDPDPTRCKYRDGRPP